MTDRAGFRAVSGGLPALDTVVTFPSGSVTETATVLATVPLVLGLAVLTDRTPFHPVDPGWPDQGPDRGTLEFGNAQRSAVVDCVVAATDGAVLHIGAEIPVRRGEPGWAFLVAHLLENPSAGPAVGETVTLRVAAAHRQALSAGHTGCHVAALALNEAVSAFWRKPVPVDGLGQPDFDRLALASSRIRPDGAVDVYRLGKSLRKRGCDTEGLLVALPQITARANATLARWVLAGGAVRIEAVGPGLTDLRTWVCELPDGVQRIACGGTHLTDLGQLEQIEAVLAPSDAELTMTTAVRRRPG